MDLDEARSILGVDEACTADALRRAYFRTAKRHKPDLDPDGFRRVREAYELILGNALGLADSPANDDEPRRAPTPQPATELDRLHRIVEHLDRDAVTDAALELIELLRLRQVSTEVVSPPPELMLFVFLELQTLGQHDIARELVDAFQNAGSALNEHTMGQDAVVIWLYVRELMDVEPRLASEVKRAIASALQGEDLLACRHQILVWAKSQPALASATRAMLKDQAPHLLDLMADALEPRPLPFTKSDIGAVLEFLRSEWKTLTLTAALAVLLGGPFSIFVLAPARTTRVLLGEGYVWAKVVLEVEGKESPPVKIAGEAALRELRAGRCARAKFYREHLATMARQHHRSGEVDKLVRWLELEWLDRCIGFGKPMP